MHTASRHAEQLAHAAQIVCNAKAYANRPHILKAAINRLRAARAEAARRTFRVVGGTAMRTAVALAVIGAGLAVGMSGLKSSLNIDATLAQAEALRGM